MNSNVDRRHFLRLAAAGSTAAIVGACASGGSSTSPATDEPSSTSAGAATDGGTSAPTNSQAPAASKASKSGERRLVVIEMSGGNDGMSTLVPYGMPGYRDLRKRTAIDTKDIIRINDEVGLHKNLARLHKQGLAVLMGVGTPKPDGSHFEMMDRWWKGNPAGGNTVTTGFLGRLADAIGDPGARAVAVSIGSGSHPSMVSRSAPTMSIPRADIGDLLAAARPDDKMLTAFQTTLREFGVGNDPGLMTVARKGTADAMRFAQTLGGLDDADNSKYPGSTLGEGLRLAARLLDADNGVRIIHVPFGGDFDTHDDHIGRHADLMSQLDEALDEFLKDLKRRDLDGSVLVATTSEFGRTAKDNGSAGLDHGAASVALLAGPVKAGVHGEHSALTNLDDRDNLRATVGFESYYATIAEGWFGVPAADVLPTGAAVVGGVLKA